MTGPKSIIQVPMDRELLSLLDRLSARQRRPRAAVIREACRRYAQQVERDQQDRQYEEGYLRLPDGPGVGEAQAAVSAGVLEEERW